MTTKKKKEESVMTPLNIAVFIEETVRTSEKILARQSTVSCSYSKGNYSLVILSKGTSELLYRDESSDWDLIIYRYIEEIGK